MSTLKKQVIELITNEELDLHFLNRSLKRLNERNEKSWSAEISKRIQNTIHLMDTANARVKAYNQVLWLIQKNKEEQAKEIKKLKEFIDSNY